MSELWAIGYDDIERADEVCEEIQQLGWGRHCLILEDIAVVVRHEDGSFVVNHEPISATANILGFTVVGFLAGLVVAAPLGGAAIGALIGGVGSVAASAVGISDEFIREVEVLMMPGTSALFVLDDVADMNAALQTIRGLGGTVLKTNVDLERAKLIQSTLAAPPAGTKGS